MTQTKLVAHVFNMFLTCFLLQMATPPTTQTKLVASDTETKTTSLNTAEEGSAGGAGKQEGTIMRRRRKLRSWTQKRR
jgi:hypothetical protein